ncbi:MAG: endonuclease/exonuclease/phosphatase family protein [Planctomycetota bacterium]|jgi:endonuclease/exonuclease/phosphatase family metal-dependent hydrolase
MFWMRGTIAVLLAGLVPAFSFFPGADREEVTVATWNIEHLGCAERGARGIGKGDLGRRTDEQLQAIADFIRDDLRADIVAIQEAALAKRGERWVCDPLEKIAAALGPEWRYRAATPRNPNTGPDDPRNLHNVILWNSARVDLVAGFDLDMPDIEVGGVPVFSRRPLAGYFRVRGGAGDFLLVNVHFERGQDNDENHLVAMVMIEQHLDAAVRARGFREPDRIILGDFNDNPWAKNGDGERKYSDLLYRYMAEKGYTDLVTEATGHTRMNKRRTSIIDHVLVTGGMAEGRARKHMPADTSKPGLAEWRKTYSDHFPLTFGIRVADRDDDANE